MTGLRTKLTDAMDPLKQYIELFRDNREIIDAHSAPAINALRGSALEELEGDNLTAEPGTEMFAPDFGVNINRMDLPADVASAFRCGVPNLSTLLAVVVNDAFKPTARLSERLPEGVTFCSLRKAALEHPELVEPYYGSLAELTDAATAVNTLLVQDGVLLHVARGVQLEKPLQLVNLFSSPVPMLAMRRVLVVVEDGASASLLTCDHTQQGCAPCLSSEVVEIILGRDSHFDYYDIEESNGESSRRSSLYARQGEGSNLLVNGMTLAAGNTRNDYRVDMSSPRCTSMLAGMVIASGTEQVENRTRVNHTSDHGHSNQLFKYVLDDRARGTFDGAILVAPEAVNTEAYQSNRNLLASTDARMHTRPQLEIYCDDVRCSHGATTGQLSAEELFYMRSRGIPEAEARIMLMQAFMADVLDTVRIPSLRDRLRLLVEKRFVGQETFCSDCAVHNDCHDE